MEPSWLENSSYIYPRVGKCGIGYRLGAKRHKSDTCNKQSEAKQTLDEYPRLSTTRPGFG